MAKKSQSDTKLQSDNARKSQSGIDDEQIIRWRDDVASAAPGELPDSNARRALADARLRALAFSLAAEQDTRNGAADDAQLLAYLLDTLPPDRRMTLERTLRGDAAAFERLITLRAALNSQTEMRDRDRADDRSRKIPRHTVGRLDVRSTGEVLQFKDARDLRVPEIEQLLRASHVARRLTASERRDSSALRGRGRKPDFLISHALDRARRDFHFGLDLVQVLQPLLARWQASNRQQPEGRMLEEELKELLRQLQQLGARIGEDIGEIDLVTDEGSPVVPAGASFLLADVRFAEANLRADHDIWTDAFDIEAGPWVLHLTGTALPKPQLAIALRANRDGLSRELFLTLVRPARRFEIVDLDAAGAGKVALPPGESVVLVQDDEVWEVRLNLLNSDELADVQ